MRALELGLVFGVAFGFVTTTIGVRADEEKISPDKLPAAVLEAVKKRFPEADDDGTGEQVKDEADEVMDLMDGERATRFDEQVIACQEADEGGHKGCSIAPVPNSDGYGPIKGGKRLVATEPWVQ